MSVPGAGKPLGCSRAPPRWLAARESEVPQVRDASAEDGGVVSACSRRPGAFTHLAEWHAVEMWGHTEPGQGPAVLSACSLHKHE